MHTAHVEKVGGSDFIAWLTWFCTHNKGVRLSAVSNCGVCLVCFSTGGHLGSYPHLVRILPMSTGGLPGSCPLGGKGERGERKEGRGERGEKGG